MKSKKRKMRTRQKAKKIATRNSRNYHGGSTFTSQGLVASEPSEHIMPEDILYRDALVCILRPEVKKGVVIMSEHDIIKGKSLCEIGLKTGELLKSEGGLNRYTGHPYSFFHAPFFSTKVDHSTIQSEIEGLYGPIRPSKSTETVYIRVDPAQTSVFSSQIRIKKPGDNEELFKSRKSLLEYLYRIEENQHIMDRDTLSENYHYEYDLYSSRLVAVQNRAPPTVYNNFGNGNDDPEMYASYPHDRFPIERNSEILVSVPHLTREYFVACH